MFRSLAVIGALLLALLGSAVGSAAELAKGQACRSDQECSSGFCTDGVCCESRCKGTCERCSSPLGSCDATPSGQDPDNDCPLAGDKCMGATCNGLRACSRKPEGAVCEVDAAGAKSICQKDACVAPAVTPDAGAKRVELPTRAKGAGVPAVGGEGLTRADGLGRGKQGDLCTNHSDCVSRRCGYVSKDGMKNKVPPQCLPAEQECAVTCLPGQRADQCQSLCQGLVPLP